MSKVSRLPWERQKGETRKSYEAFCVYRDLGPSRSLRKVAEELSKSETLMKRWASRENWVERAELWDDEQDRIVREAQIQERKEMAKRHAQLSLGLQQKIVERLRTVRPDELSPADLVRWLETSVKVERLSRGEPTEHVEQEHRGAVTLRDGPDLTSLTDEELEQLERLASKVTGSGSNTS